MGVPDQLVKCPLPGLPPILTVPAPGGVWGKRVSSRVVDVGGEAQSFGPWDASIHNGSRPFSERVFCLNGGKGKVGGDVLLGS